MGTQKTLIGTIPIKQIEQEVTDFMEQVSEDSSVLLDVFGLDNDPEGRSEIILDSSSKIISYRKEDGTKVESVGIETPDAKIDNLRAENIDYSDKNLIDLANALKKAGLNSSYDLRLPQVRITSDLLTVEGNDIIGLTLAKNAVECLITFISPNKAFAEEGTIAYQGNSTLYNVKKGFSVDFTNKHRFKNWVEMDGFHLKAYYTYNLRIRDVASNRLIERIYKQREVGTNRPYNTYNDFGQNSIYNRIDGGALCHVDSFPVELYINDSYWGLYFFNIKKSRSNYLLTKKNVHHIQVEAANDAYYTDEWFADGGQGWGKNSGNAEYIEIRNPNKDSGNSSFELGVEPNAGEVKTAWQEFIGRLNAITTNTTVEQLQQFLNVREWVDYIIISQLIYHSDNWCKNTLYTTWDCVVTNGVVSAHWSPLLYDMDQCIHAGIGQDPFANKAYEKCPWLSTLMEVLDTNIKQRYAELRNDKTVDEFTMKNILEELFLEIGYDVYSDEVKRWDDGGVMDSMSGIVSAFNDRVSYLDTLWDYSNNNN